MARKKDTTWAELWLESGIDVPGKTIYLKGPIDEDTLDIITSGFHLMGPKDDVTVLINSPGGNTWYGMGIYDVINNHQGSVTARVIGEACSMAFVIVQAASVREATPNSVLMHHVGDVSFGSQHPENFKGLLKFNERHDDRIDNIMLNRVNERMHELGEEPWTLAKWKRRDIWDRWMFPEEAIELGLLDNIWTGEE